MQQEGRKRSASVAGSGRAAKRLPSPDEWSENEHRRQDEKIQQRLLDKSGKPRDLIIGNAFCMAAIVKSVGDVAIESPYSDFFQVRGMDSYVEPLEQDSELMKLVGESHASRSYKPIRCLGLLRKTSGLEPPQAVSLTSGQQDAVRQSWGREFSGTAVQALWRHIVAHYGSEPTQVYAHYAAIVQSSGMGKSRAVDELGKEHFAIPINLRGPHSVGFPPADGEVRDFLAGSGSQVDVYRRACAFLEALFLHTAETLKTQFGDIDDTKISSEFRTKMTEGQTFEKPNPFRVMFYAAVVQIATMKFAEAKSKEDNMESSLVHTLPNAEDAVYKLPTAEALRKLIDVLSGVSRDSPTPSHLKTRQRGCTKADGPLIILAFDEAHTLTDPKITETRQWSNFSELRHALRALHRFSLFSLFMSTTGKISEFTSARSEDYSARILTGKLVLIQPFTDVGFDTLARRISLVLAPDLKELTTNMHMAYLGRPLFGSLYEAGDRTVREDIISFAAMKLLCGESDGELELTDEQSLACLSQRIPLELNSTTYIAQANERKQVEGRMRVCLEIDAAFESMSTVSASEPLLSEAAYSIMARATFNVPKAMKSILEGFSIHKGDRGELLTMLFFTLARDNAVGPPDQHFLPTNSRIIQVASFLTNLFQGGKLKKLCADFLNARMHFNHYVKVHEHAAIDAESLILLSSRGAAILCAHNQYAIDGINPFLYRGTKLDIGDLGLILWQSNNDSTFTDEPLQALFDAMDVYDLKILKKNDTAIPLIKIVFALASSTPSLKVVKHEPSSQYDAIVYDIWCAGISPDTLKVVEPAQADTWAALLQASYGWESIYKGKDVDKELRRSMNPGAGTDINHWVRWAERST